MARKRKPKDWSDPEIRSLPSQHSYDAEKGAKRKGVARLDPAAPKVNANPERWTVAAFCSNDQARYWLWWFWRDATARAMIRLDQHEGPVWRNQIRLACWKLDELALEHDLDYRDVARDLMEVFHWRCRHRFRAGELATFLAQWDQVVAAWREWRFEEEVPDLYAAPIYAEITAGPPPGLDVHRLGKWGEDKSRFRA